MENIKQINHDIRNYKLLSNSQIDSLKEISKKELIEIIKLYNESQQILNEFLNELD